MAAYYQRQRLPPPTQSFLDELNVDSAPPIAKDTTQHERSFLIFPEPAHAPAPSTGGPVSPSNSATSLPTSLVASVARRSDSHGPSGSTRSASREAVDWEELRGPLPQHPSLRLPRGRRPRLSHQSSSSAGGGGLTPLSELERRGSGWEWTLDKDDDNISLNDMLLSWPRVAAGSWRSSEEGHTRYDDAYSHRSEEEPVHVDMSEARSRRRTFSYTLEAPIRPTRLLEVADGDLRPRRLSLRLSSPSSRRQPKTARSPARPRAIPPAPKYKLPFKSLLQAILSLDQSTLDLIEEREPEATTPSIFGVRDPLATPTQSTVDLPESPSSSETTTLVRGFRATHLMPTNPFAFPWYLLEWGFDYGIKGVMALHGTLVEEDFTSV